MLGDFYNIFWHYFTVKKRCTYNLKDIFYNFLVLTIDFLVLTMYSITEKGELVNWLPVCKSKSLFLKVLARLNSGIQIILWFNGIYDSKLELTKPNRLNQLLEHDKIISDQASRWKKAHFKRRSNSSFFFCKIKFHPVVMGTSDACPRQNV